MVSTNCFLFSKISAALGNWDWGINWGMINWTCTPDVLMEGWVSGSCPAEGWERAETQVTLLSSCGECKAAKSGEGSMSSFPQRWQWAGRVHKEALSESNLETSFYSPSSNIPLPSCFLWQVPIYMPDLLSAAEVGDCSPGASCGTTYSQGSHGFLVTTPRPGGRAMGPVNEESRRAGPRMEVTPVRKSPASCSHWL